jgi:hypothetical protein
MVATLHWPIYWKTKTAMMSLLAVALAVTLLTGPAIADDRCYQAVACQRNHREVRGSEAERKMDREKAISSIGARFLLQF